MKNIKQTAKMAKASPSRVITTQSIPFEKRHCRNPPAPVSPTVPPSPSVSATHASLPGSFCWNNITHVVLASCIGQTSIPDKKGPLLQHASFSCFHYLFTFYLAARFAHRHKKKNYTHLLWMSTNTNALIPRDIHIISCYLISFSFVFKIRFSRRRKFVPKRDLPPCLGWPWCCNVCRLGGDLVLTLRLN